MFIQYESFKIIYLFIYLTHMCGRCQGIMVPIDRTNDWMDGWMDGCLQIMTTHFVIVFVRGKGEDWQPR
jgi:hypothetical protein